jgi:uncharacterized protein DUF4058
MNRGFSQAEINHVERGPFPGQIDPWAETGHYFKGIHSDMISNLIAMTKQPLFALGYFAGREASLQISEGREPDIHILRQDAPSERFRKWNYELAAAEVLAEPGVAVEIESELEAVHIRDTSSGDLVTVIEIVSPTNKISMVEITAYQERRTRLYLERGVNVVEIAPTRSIKRLTYNAMTAAYPYHISILLPGAGVRVAGVQWGQPLSRIALPLRDAVVPVELHDAYTGAYRQNTTAWHLQHDSHYSEDQLPFPSLLTAEQRGEALAAVHTWQAELERLRGQKE